MPLCMTHTRWHSEARNVPVWRPIYASPCDRALQLAVVDNSGVHVFSLPCCRILGYWCDTQTKGRLRLNLPLARVRARVVDELALIIRKCLANTIDLNHQARQVDGALFATTIAASPLGDDHAF